MRITILTKLMATLLFLTIVPLVILGYLAIGDAKKLGMEAADEAKSMGKTAIQDSTTALSKLGEEMIKLQAELTADRISTYILAHPEMTAEEFQNDPAFIEIAKQKVGETGYLSVSKWKEETGGIFAVHPMKQVIGVPSDIVLKDTPELLALVKEVEDAHASNEFHKGAGTYYKWKEADNIVRDKYIWITSRADVRTIDGFEMNVSATTYIDEFSKPALAAEKKIKTSLDNTTAKILAQTEGLSTKNTILLVTIITILIVVLTSILFARSLTRPINQLTKAGNKISKGELDVQIPDVKANDEIKDLSESFKSALAAIAFLMENVNKK